MEKKYYRLKDTSGTYWSVVLGVSFVRDAPVELESSPELKSLLAKGVIIEVDKNEFEAYYGIPTEESGGNTVGGEIVDPIKPEGSQEANSSIQVGEVLPETVLPTQKDEGDAGSLDEKTDEAPVTEKENAEPPQSAQVEEPDQSNAPAPAAEENLKKELNRSEITELIQKALEKEVFTTNTGWMKYGTFNLGRGIAAVVDYLLSAPKLVAEIQGKVAPTE